VRKTATIQRPIDYLYIRPAGPLEATEELRLRDHDGSEQAWTSQTRVSGIPRQEEPLTDG
jgi:hypothetical protein